MFAVWCGVWCVMSACMCMNGSGSRPGFMGPTATHIQRVQTWKEGSKKCCCCCWWWRCVTVAILAIPRTNTEVSKIIQGMDWSVSTKTLAVDSPAGARLPCYPIACQTATTGKVKSQGFECLTTLLSNPELKSTCGGKHGLTQK